MIYSEDPAALAAMTELLMLYEQSRSMARLLLRCAHCCAFSLGAPRAD